MLPERIAQKINPEPNSGCWLWGASVNPDGYGHIKVAGKLHLAHRVVFEAIKGPIPAGLEIDHLCRVRSCVNPDHLEPVTHAVNIARGLSPEQIAGFQRAKSHCPNGHAYTGKNLYTSPVGHRRCKACARERDHLRWTGDRREKSNLARKRRGS